MPTALLVLALLTSLPSENKTAWMRLESFRLTIGMQRAEVAGALDKWKPKRGANDDELVVDYASDKALTLEFRNDRLHAVRFELFAFLPQIRKAFEEERAYLREARGAPRKASTSVLIYDTALPNVMVAVIDNPKSEQGKKGLGVLAVRYYDPR